jgi:hypothetical protein
MNRNSSIGSRDAGAVGLTHILHDIMRQMEPRR